MSWKATAYVNDLTGKQVTIHEKLLMFVLADYHHNEQGFAWPSIPTLAERALMSERMVYYALTSLQEKNLIRRISRKGIGSAYQFVELDSGKAEANPVNTPAPHAVVKKVTPCKTPAIAIAGDPCTTPAQSFSLAIRKNIEPVNTEPVKRDFKETICERCGSTGAYKSKNHPNREIYCDCAKGQFLRRIEEAC